MNRDDVTGEPDVSRTHALGGEILFGRRIAKAQIGASYNISGSRFFNNDQSIRDRESRKARLFGRWNLSPRFSVLNEVEGDFVNYLDPTFEQNSRTYKMLAGVVWEATAKTSGEAKFGVINKDFHALDRNSIHENTWDARVTWAPKSFSRLTLFVARDSAEAASGGGTVLDRYGYQWRHRFNPRLLLENGGEFQTATVDGVPGDDQLDFDAELKYKLRRWLTLSLGYAAGKRISSDSAGGFDDHSIFLRLDAQRKQRLGGGSGQ